MPRLSLYRPNRTNDYRFFDRTISEMYTVGGLDIYVHKYLGPKTGGEDSTESGNYDATQPIYPTTDPLFIQDLLLLENRDRAYDPDIYRMRGVYNQQDIDFNLTQFGLFLNNDTLFITFHYNDMIDTFGRKLMSGDVLEFPNLRDMNPLDPAIPRALPRYYVIQDANLASEGFSQTWMPHLWRVKATPMVNAQEYQEIINKPFVSEQIWDPGNFYPAGSIVNYGDNYYQAQVNVPVGTEITDTNYWTPIDPPTTADVASTRPKDLEINDALLAQAELEVPLSGYDTVKFYILPTNEDGTPADPVGVTADGSASGQGPQTITVPVNYSSGSVSIGGNTVSASIGIAFPPTPALNDYAVRTDFFPSQLYQYNGSDWIVQVMSGSDSISYAAVTVPPTTTSNTTITVDSTYINTSEADVSPRADGYTMGYLTGDGVAPNGLPVTPGVSFPPNPTNGQYCLRLDYFPNRLFRYNGTTWIKIEDAVRTDLTNGPLNQTLRSSFVNNPYTVSTTDQGNIPSRQSLSEILKPRADNGSAGGDLPARPRPGTQPGQRNNG
jgi:hypothetical protein